MNARTIAVFTSAIAALATTGYAAHTSPTFKEAAITVSIVVLIAIVTIGIVVPLAARFMSDPNPPARPTPALMAPATADTGTRS